jgi:flagellar biosynthetic protein FlhB
MADDTQDKSSQTEEPTEKKIADARQKGNTPNSRELGSLACVIAGFVIAASLSTKVAVSLSTSMTPLIENSSDLISGISVGDLTQLFSRFIFEIGTMLAPAFLIFIGAGIFAAFAQGHVVLTGERIRPKAERISLKNGVQRLFSTTALVEFGYGLTKLAMVGAITGFMLWSTFANAQGLVFTDISTMPSALRDLTVRLLIAVASAMSLIAVVDIIWRRFDWRRKLRMSHREIKDEHKQVEGDPMMKARLRDIRRQRARKRMLSAVPNATVVIVNPTHYAVALRYTRGEDAVPVCVAKGLDLIALRIREIAEENGVTVVEEPPLARALHAALEVDQPISREFYRAVAEIISYVYGQNEQAGYKKTGARLAPVIEVDSAG